MTMTPDQIDKIVNPPLLFSDGNSCREATGWVADCDTDPEDFYGWRDLALGIRKIEGVADEQGRFLLKIEGGYTVSVSYSAAHWFQDRAGAVKECERIRQVAIKDRLEAIERIKEDIELLRTLPIVDYDEPQPSRHKLIDDRPMTMND